MKRYNLLGLICLVLLLITSCSNNKGFYKAQIKNELIAEHWLSRINLNPDRWYTGADAWYYSSDPRTFINNPAIGRSRGDSVMITRIPQFRNISVEGPFRIQVVGRQTRSSTFVSGPNDAVRHTLIEAHGSTLYVRPAPDCQGCTNLDRVVIRVGVEQLNTLQVSGGSLIEGKQISSNGLTVQAVNGGHVVLAGNMNVISINQTGNSTVSLFGVSSPNLTIDDNNSTLNLAGQVGVSRINKSGGGNIHIIGVNTDNLSIDSSGSGVITLSGIANIKNLNARNNSRIYIYWVKTGGIYANLHDYAHLGLAGSTDNLEIYLDGHAKFGGKYLKTGNAYITTRNWAHANISVSARLFANAMDQSSIYFFTSPNVISRYTTGEGVVIPIFGDSCAIDTPCYGSSSMRPTPLHITITEVELNPVKAAEPRFAAQAPTQAMDIDDAKNPYQGASNVTYGKYHL